MTKVLDGNLLKYSPGTTTSGLFLRVVDLIGFLTKKGLYRRVFIDSAAPRTIPIQRSMRGLLTQSSKPGCAAIPCLQAAHPWWQTSTTVRAGAQRSTLAAAPHRNHSAPAM